MANVLVRVLAVWALSCFALCGQQAWSQGTSSGSSSSIVLKLDGPSEIFVDGEKVETDPGSSIRKLTVSPGEHFLEVRSNGRAWKKKVSVPAGMQIAEEVHFGSLEKDHKAPNSGRLPLSPSAKSRPAGVPLDPEHFNAEAPALFKTRFTTTKGEFTIEVHRDWAPNGADRFYNLVRSGFYRDASFFRVIPNFVVPFGIAADPQIQIAWHSATINDDPIVQSNKHGFVSFAKSSQANSGTTQVFINLADSPRLDTSNVSPIGNVTDGMGVVDNLYSGYGESAPWGTGPNQNRLEQEGRDYVERDFPNLDRVISAAVLADPLPAVVSLRPPLEPSRSPMGGESSISDEVTRIERGQHSALPPAIASASGVGSSFGPIERKVENGTSYVLTVLFAGPVERRITLAPGESGQLTLPEGTYKVAARVSAPNVLPFFGVQSYSSRQEYTSHFYVQ